MVNREILYIVDGNINWSNHYGKKYGVSSKKLKIGVPYNPAIPLLSIYPKQMKIGFEENTHSHVNGSIIHNNQDMETTQVPINRWMDKKDVIYTLSGILFSHEKGIYLPICDNVDGPWAHYAKWDESDRERQVLYNIIYMWNLKKLNV